MLRLIAYAPTDGAAFFTHAEAEGDSDTGFHTSFPYTPEATQKIDDLREVVKATLYLDGQNQPFEDFKALAAFLESQYIYEIKHNPKLKHVRAVLESLEKQYPEKIEGHPPESPPHEGGPKSDNGPFNPTEDLE